jgi:hypothetical protein
VHVHGASLARCVRDRKRRAEPAGERMRGGAGEAAPAPPAVNPSGLP